MKKYIDTQQGIYTEEELRTYYNQIAKYNIINKSYDEWKTDWIMTGDLVEL